VVRARIIQEAIDDRLPHFWHPGRIDTTIPDCGHDGIPVRTGVLRCQRVPKVALDRLQRRFREGPLEPCARRRVIDAQSLEPAPGFVLQLLEGGLPGDPPDHATPSFCPFSTSRRVQSRIEVRTTGGEMRVRRPRPAVDRRRAGRPAVNGRVVIRLR
jgi:hypothetical protein